MRVTDVNISTEQEREFDESGYLVVPNAIPRGNLTRVIDAIDDVTRDQPGGTHNIADIIGLRQGFLELIDLPAVLPKIQALLGNNIWVNHSHLNVNPPPPRTEKNDVADYGWHRDGGAINSDIPPPAPLLSIKVGFYLSDLSETGRGQTYIVAGSHKSGEKPPNNHQLPPTAKPICIRPGTAVLFDRRVIHSIRSQNASDITRKAVFVQYAFRWMCPVDAMTVEHLRDQSSSAQLQLLGLSTAFRTIDGAEGRSGLYYPTVHDVPIGNTLLHRFVDRVGSIPKKVLRRLLR